MFGMFCACLAAFAGPAANCKDAERAEEFNLSQVQISRDSPFYKAMEIDKKYLLGYDYDRLVAYSRREAGLPEKAAPYGSWEMAAPNGGATAGHALSALSMLYASTRDPQVLEKINFLVDEFSACQDSDGYINMGQKNRELLEKIKREARGNFYKDRYLLLGTWAPFYWRHKVYAGLRDAWVFAGNKKAKDCFLKGCDWLCDYMDNFSDEEFENILHTEHGGFNEVLCDASKITEDKQKSARYLKNALKFSHKEFLEPLSRNEDILPGYHSNTQIPKFIGFQKISEALNGDEKYRAAAENFWKLLVDTQTFSMGGNSLNEHFKKPEDLIQAVSRNGTVETCNTYNMLKLTELLFAASPRAEYADFYERALYNHILPSQNNANPELGGLVYMTHLRPRHYRNYSRLHEDFWCCVGTGLENHTKYGKFIYSHSDKGIYVNLFIPSTLDWSEKGIRLSQQTNFPNSPNTTLKISLQKPREFSLKIRKPYWIKSDSLRVSVNSKAQTLKAGADSYVEIKRLWRDKDEVKIELPMSLRLETMKGLQEFNFIMYGPLVLAKRDGTEGIASVYSTNGVQWVDRDFLPLADIPFILKRPGEDISKIVRKDDRDRLSFTVKPEAVDPRGQELKLFPFNEIYEERYTLLFPVGDADALKKFRQKYAPANTPESEKILSRALDSVDIAEQQPEIDHKFKQGRGAELFTYKDRVSRRAKDWISYELTVPADKFKKSMKLKLFTERLGSQFPCRYKILVNGAEIAECRREKNEGEKFIFDYYEIPQELVEKSEGKFLVKFEMLEREVEPLFRVGIVN